MTHIRAFANLIQKALGDDVKLWVTLNEPVLLAGLGYVVGVRPPQRFGDFRGAFRALVNMFTAHVAIYKDFKIADPDSTITIAKSITPSRLKRVNRANQSYFRRFLNTAVEQAIISPLMSLADHAINGAYFEMMLSGRLSLLGFEENIEGIVGSIDVLGFNHYTSIQWDRLVQLIEM